jgi:RNA polymerase sigma-70 factor (ECF subfamily)
MAANITVFVCIQNICFSRAGCRRVGGTGHEFSKIQRIAHFPSSYHQLESNRMADTDEDIDWVAQSRTGDHAAFEALIRKHQQMIHTLTYRMTGSLADCKDLAQETFVRAYRQLDSYQGGAKFSSWLYRIAVNACLDWRRQEQRRERLLHEWSEEAATSASGNGFVAADDTLSREVQAALLKLPGKQRAAIVLTVYGGHNHADAAKSLGCSETTISWRIFSARRKLKKLLRNHGGSHE